MTKNNEEPQSLIDLPVKDRVRVMIENQFIDITDGFPAKSATELEKILIDFLLKKEVARFPIVGTKDNHVFMLIIGDRQDHQTLLQKLQDPEGNNVLYTTSLEGFYSSIPDKPRYLELKLPDRTSYIPVGRGTDLQNLPGFISEWGYNDSPKAMRQLFGTIPGVTYRHPPSDLKV